MDKEILLNELEKFKNNFISKISNIYTEDEEFINPSLLPDEIYKLHKKGITGKGVKIGVIDSQFNNCNGNILPKSVMNSKGELVTTTSSSGGHGNLITEKIIGKDIGYAPDAEVYYREHYKITNNDDENLIKSYNDLTECIQYMIDLNVDIISMSIGYTEFDVNKATLPAIKKLNESITKAYNKGIILVAAAGNNHEQAGLITVGVPAIFDEVISVGALAENGMNRTTYSSVGKVDVMIQAEGLWHYTIDGKLEKYYSGGTSSACPCVSAIIALWKQQDQDLNTTDIRNIFKEYCEDLEVEGVDDKTGYGKIVPIEIPKNFKHSKQSQDKTATNKFYAEANERINKLKESEVYEIKAPLNVLKKKLNVEELHKKGIKGKGVKVAILACGCQKNDDYNIKRYIDCTAENKIWGEAFSENEYGNIQTSIIASKTLGIAPESEISILRTYRENGWLTGKDMNKAVKLCIDNKIDIAVIGNQFPIKSILELAKTGCIVIAPTFNNTAAKPDNELFYGMASENENCIGVTAIRPDNSYEYTEKGPFVGKKIDVAAYSEGFDFVGNNGVEFFQGKENKIISLYNVINACCQVAGVLSLIKQQDPSLDVFKAREYLKSSCKDINIDKKYAGYGLIQAKLL